MVEGCLQDQRLTPRNGGAMASMQLTGEEMRAYRPIAFIAAEGGARRNCGRPRRAGGFGPPNDGFPKSFCRTAARRDLGGREQLRVAAMQNPPVIAAHRLVGDGRGHFGKPRFECRAPLRRRERTGLDLPRPQHVGERTRRGKHIIHRLAAARAHQIVRILAVGQRRQFEALPGPPAARRDQARERRRAGRHRRRRSRG